MRRRLYFLLPGVLVTQQIVDELLLARIEARHIHVLGPRGMDLDDLPEANVFQKTDLVHGAQVGAIVGAALGALTGVFFIAFQPGGSRLPLIAILIGFLLGAVFGLWVASMVAAAVPNSRLKQFQPSIDRGMLLLMVDVPFGETQRITDLVTSRHPEAWSEGLEPTIPAFP